MAPVVDMVNHLPKDNSKAMMCNLRLETEVVAEVRKSQGYDKLRGYYNLTPFLEESQFAERSDKTKMCRLAECAGQMMVDHQRCDHGQEYGRALETMSGLLACKPELEIWDFPDWDSSEEDDDTEDSHAINTHEVPQESKFAKGLRELESKSSQPVSGVNTTSFAKISANCQLASTLDTSDPFPSTSESTWYKADDPSTNFMIVNRKNKYVSAGSQITIFYGSLSNKELCLEYGFALQDNSYDYFEWPREEGEAWKFYKKHICMEALGDIRQKLTLPSTTESLVKEKFVLQFYKKSVEEMLSQFKRGDDKTEVLLKDPDLSYRKKTVILVEQGWKDILREHLHLCSLASSILDLITDHKTLSLKQIYLQPFKHIDSSISSLSILESRLRLKHYLKYLHLLAVGQQSRLTQSH